MAEKIHVVIDVPFEFAGRDQLVQFMNEKFPQADISVVRKEEVSEPQVVETLVERDPSASPAETAEALKFFDWAYKNGGKMAAELDYVPLPEGLIKQVRATWKSEIKGIPAIAAK